MHQGAGRLGLVCRGVSLARAGCGGLRLSVVSVDQKKTSISLAHLSFVLATSTFVKARIYAIVAYP